MKKILLAMVRFYRKHLSNPSVPKCRFVPTCSLYALEAIEKFGASKGTWLTVKRLLRCHPFCKSGYDPVP